LIDYDQDLEKEWQEDKVVEEDESLYDANNTILRELLESEEAAAGYVRRDASLSKEIVFVAACNESAVDSVEVYRSLHIMPVCQSRRLRILRGWGKRLRIDGRMRWMIQWSFRLCLWWHCFLHQNAMCSIAFSWEVHWMNEGDRIGCVPSWASIGPTSTADDHQRALESELRLDIQSKL
jgi:hypothetical protein